MIQDFIILQSACRYSIAMLFDRIIRQPILSALILIPVKKLKIWAVREKIQILHGPEDRHGRFMEWQWLTGNRKRRISDCIKKCKAAYFLSSSAGG